MQTLEKQESRLNGLHTKPNEMDCMLVFAFFRVFLNL